MDGQGMQFKHTYMSKDKMKKGGDGVFSSQFKSYIADGESALQDKIMGGVSREDVMKDVRRNLREQMREANDRSNFAAMRMQSEHQQLRIQMQEALLKAKEATRQRKLLDAKMYAEQSKQSNHNAEVSEFEIDNMVYQQEEAAHTESEKGVSQDGMVTAEDFDQQMRDISYMKSLKDQATANKSVAHHKNMFSLFRAIGKRMERNSIEDEQKKQDDIIAEQKAILKTKTEEWNKIRRKNYETDTFRQYYKAYDMAASRYRMMNRSGADGAAPVKDVKEYVGEFDIEKLDQTLDQLEENPYLNVRVEVKNKKAGRSNKEEDFIKSHTKMTIMGEADETGYQKRYKINNDFEGYEASRQFKKDDPTALTEKRAVLKVLQSAERLKLNTEEKDAAGKFIYTEDNVEIMQAKQDKWFGAKTLNGVFLFGEFISTDRKIIGGKKDASTVGVTNTWSKVAKKEEVRRAVLKAAIFRHINSKTIQHAAGYGAGAATKADEILARMVDKLAHLSVGEKGLPGYEKAVDDGVAINQMFNLAENIENTAEMEKTELDNDIDLQKEKLQRNIFSQKNDKAILKSAKKGVLPDPTEAKWEEIMKGDKEDEKKALPREAKIKVAYDVIRQEFARDRGTTVTLMDTTTRAGQVLDALKGDQKALSDLALLLLSSDANPEYWDMAKVICSNMIMTGFEQRWKKTFDSRFNRALAHGRASTGQLMRVALIDELNANRSHLDLNNLLEGIMPTRWKQYKEDVMGKRGFGARIHQRFVDGSILSFINEAFTSYIDIVDGLETVSKDTLRNLGVANSYSTALTSALNMGAIAEAGAYAVSDLFGDEAYQVMNDKGKLETKHTSDDRRNIVGLVFTGAQNIIKLIKIGNKFLKTKEKQAKAKKKKDPSYDPKPDLAFTEDCYYQLVSSGVNFLLGVSTVVAKQAGAKQLKSILGMAKSAIGTYEEFLNYKKASYQDSRIKKTEKNFTALNDKEVKTEEDEQMLEVLKDNSQLQYGMACAKRKAKEDKHNAVLGAITNAGKTVINAVKAFWPAGKKNPVFIVVDAIWGTVMTGAKLVTEVVHDKLATRANIGKMIGEKFKGVNRGVLQDVLRREAGIESADYLTDLARIFMSIDTDVFMKEAKTDAEKKIGVTIAQTLFNNKEFNTDNLKKMNVGKLMGVMGVKGNFHTILKHSLA